MKEKIVGYVSHFKDRTFISSLVVSLLLFAAAIFANFYAGTYATTHASNGVTDLILSNIRVYDVDGLFVYGTLTYWGIFIIICFCVPRKVPYILKSLSLLIFIRCVFISLTHIGPFATQIAITPVTIVNKFSFGADLFFSGHTAIPFMLALIFWNYKN